MAIFRRYTSDGGLLLMELTTVGGATALIYGPTIAHVVAYHGMFGDGAIIAFSGGERIEVRESYDMIRKVLMHEDY